MGSNVSLETQHEMECRSKIDFFRSRVRLFHQRVHEGLLLTKLLKPIQSIIIDYCTTKDLLLQPYPYPLLDAVNRTTWLQTHLISSAWCAAMTCTLSSKLTRQMHTELIYYLIMLGIDVMVHALECPLPACRTFGKEIAAFRHHIEPTIADEWKCTLSTYESWPFVGTVQFPFQECEKNACSAVYLIDSLQYVVAHSDLSN